MEASSTTTRNCIPRTRKGRKPRKTLYKKKKLAIPETETKKLETEEASSTTSDSFPKMGTIEFEGVIDDNDHGSPCSTPKAQRFRIPAIETCPPAPKKQRVLSNCSFHRRPIAFFASPDLELFFCFALRDIQV